MKTNENDNIDGIAAKVASISPRGVLPYLEDRKQAEQTRIFLQSPFLPKLLVIIRTKILARKPDNILDYLVDEFFAVKNERQLREEILS